MQKLYVFDMDGTLLPGTTANLELARVLGKEEELWQLETMFAAGEMDTVSFAKEIFDLWGIPSKQVIRQAFLSSRKLANILQTVDEIKREHNMVIMITMSPDYFANCFFEYGFDYIFASRFPKNSYDPMDFSRILRPDDKPMIVKMLCERMNMPLGNVVAFGDSMSDYPLFNVLEKTVAVNGDETIQSNARYNYQGKDLKELCSEFALI
ncbi:MAG: HAD-IB family phosphatase [Fibrobacterales bacterium]